MSELSLDERIHLITRNLVSGEQSLFTPTAEEHTRQKLAGGSFKLYWGTATTGKPHIAYFVPISKIADFLRAGCEVTILFADLHAYLDNQKAPWELLQYRTDYYEFIIKAMLESIGVSLEKLKFVRGTEYQLSREYSIDVYRLTSLVTERDAQKAGAEVVKKVDNPLLSGLLYPLLQVLDEKYLGVDAQFGGVDQRKIFTLSEKYLHRIGYPKCIHFMNPMVPGLDGTKMSASNPQSKIDILDDANTVTKKIRRAFCEPGNIEQNGILAFAKHVLFPIHGKLDIKRAEKFGGDISFSSFSDLEESFAKQQLFPPDLKNGVIAALNSLLEPIRAKAQAPEIQALIKKAYPVDETVEHGGAEAKKATTNKAANNNKGANNKGGKQNGANAAVSTAEGIGKLDIRVGRVHNVRDHPNADSLYLEDVDIGEEKSLQVISGLKGKVAKEDFEGSLVLVICNLKPQALRSVNSEAMVLAAKVDDKIELVRPPAGSVPGDRVIVEKYEGVPEKQINLKAKNNAFKSVSEDLKTNDEFIATYKGEPLVTKLGPCKVDSLPNAFIA